MTYDPNNVPPGGGRDRTTRREGAGSTGLIIGLVIAALVVAGLFFVWPTSTSNVATRDPGATGTTSPAPSPGAPQTPTPAPVPAPARP